MADLLTEAMRVLKVAKTTAAYPALIPHILRLPTPLYRVIAAQMLTIDGQARSSMWDDLAQRRLTEIDSLQGIILSLAAQYGRQFPLNACIHTLIKVAEEAGKGPSGIAPERHPFLGLFNALLTIC